MLDEALPPPGIREDALPPPGIRDDENRPDANMMVSAVQDNNNNNASHKTTQSDSLVCYGN